MPDIDQLLAERGVLVDRDIREVMVPYLDSILAGTEYEGKFEVITQNSPSPGENTMVVGIESEADAMNAYNAKIGADMDNNVLYYRHDRDVKIIIEINMSDNDALWMFAKYVMMCLVRDMSILSASGKFKIAQHPINEGISVKDVGARKIWTSKMAVMAKLHNIASMTSEIY